MNVSIYSGLIWLTTIIIGSLNLVIFLGSKRLSSRAFSHSILWVILWIATMSPYIGARDPETGLFFSRMTYYLGSVIASTFFYFFLTYPEDKKQSKTLVWILFIIQAIFTYIFIFTDKIIYSVYLNDAPQPWAWNFGSLSFLFELFFFGYFGVGTYILYRKYKTAISPTTKANLKYMLWVIIVGATPPSLMCIIFPRFGYYDLNWFGPVTQIIWIPIMSYSIIKYRQMNVRAVITEVLAIGMTVIFFINIFVKTPLGNWDHVITFVVFLILAAYLIKGVLKEAKQTELLKDLNDNLALKVAEQTLEIRKSFELEKKARRELEKLNETKDQFILITQHAIRTPVTIARLELDTVLKENGDGDKTRSKQVESSSLVRIKSANNSLERLTKIIDDFLSIVALKPGGNILNLTSTSLKSVMEDIIAELNTYIETKKISISYPQNETSWPLLPIDVSKMREALLIIIENAVRYNIDGGKIDIETKQTNDDFQMTITDTGVGIDTEDMEKIFGHLFHRGKKAREVNPIGMGVGLSVARAIIRAHHGEMKIESAGEGKGTKVTVKIGWNSIKN